MIPVVGNDYYLLPGLAGLPIEVGRCMRVEPRVILFAVVGTTEEPSFTIEMVHQVTGEVRRIRCGARLFKLHMGGWWREEAGCHYSFGKGQAPRFNRNT